MNAFTAPYFHAPAGQADTTGVDEDAEMRDSDSASPDDEGKPEGAGEKVLDVAGIDSANGEAFNATNEASMDGIETATEIPAAVYPSDQSHETPPQESQQQATTPSTDPPTTLPSYSSSASRALPRTSTTPAPDRWMPPPPSDDDMDYLPTPAHTPGSKSSKSKTPAKKRVGRYWPRKPKHTNLPSTRPSPGTLPPSPAPAFPLIQPLGKYPIVPTASLSTQDSLLSLIALRPRDPIPGCPTPATSDAAIIARVAAACALLLRAGDERCVPVAEFGLCVCGVRQFEEKLDEYANGEPFAPLQVGFVRGFLVAAAEGLRGMGTDEGVVGMLEGLVREGWPEGNEEGEE